MPEKVISKTTPTKLHHERLESFMDRAWGILEKYMNRIEETDVIEASDSRACSTVVKAMLDETIAAGKIVAGMKDEFLDEDPLGYIDEKILDEIIDRVITKREAKKKSRKTMRAKKSCVPRAANAGL